MNQYLDKNLKPKLAKVLEKEFGKRCKTSDLEDFPEMKNDPKASRCVVCVMYEQLDEYIDRIRPEFTNGTN